MNNTQFVGGPLEGSLNTEKPIPQCGIIHVTMLPSLPNPHRADQHMDLIRSIYTYNPTDKAFVCQPN
jgi:hypothetical protein